MTSLANLAINQDRLWQSLMEMATIGATALGGCNRQALTDLDKQGRDLFVQWCEQANCTIRIDAMGNIFARRAGSNNELPPVITGSHLDTQPTGGKFDGVYGVLAGLEVIRTLNDHNIVTECPVEVVVWTNEEGARFSPAMIGSGVWCGEFDLDYAYAREDVEHKTLGDELARIGYQGEHEAKAFAVTAAFEAHIEQGPILEAESLQIGVVTGIQGMNWYELTLHGQPCHAGPTPMEVRRDPFMSLHGILDQLYALAEANGPWARVTFGNITASPGSFNTVPETLKLAIDLRHPDQSVLDAMQTQMHSIINAAAEKHQVGVEIEQVWQSPAIAFNKDCIQAVDKATQALGYSHKQMVSGAGHDSAYISRVVPTSMIFVPCEDGISHNEAENASATDLAAGANVLLHAMLNMTS